MDRSCHINGMKPLVLIDWGRNTRATSAEFIIPADITRTKFYFSEVRAKGAAPVRTEVARVVVKEPRNVITITQQPEKIITVKYKKVGALLAVRAKNT